MIARVAVVFVLVSTLPLYALGVFTDDGPVPVAQGLSGPPSISKSRYVAACAPHLPRSTCNCFYGASIKHLSEPEIEFWLATNAGNRSKVRRIRRSGEFDESRYGQRMMRMMMESRPCLEQAAAKYRKR